MHVIRKVLVMLTAEERRRLRWLVPVVIAMALAEVAGIAALGPFLALVADPSGAGHDPLVRLLRRSFPLQSGSSLVLTAGGVALAALVVGNAVLAFGTRMLFTFGALREHTVARRLLDRYLQQPYAFFLDRNAAGLAGTILHETSTVVRRILIPGLLAIAKAVSALAILAFLVVLDPAAAAMIGGLLGGAYALVFWITRRRMAHMGRERVRRNRERYTFAADALGAVKDLKMSGRELEAVHRFSGPSLQHAISEARQEVTVRIPRFVLEAFALGGLVLVTLVSVSAGRGSATLLPLLGVYAFGGYRTLLALYDVFHGLSEVRYGMGALDEVVAMLGDAHDPKGERWAFEERASIRPLAVRSEIEMTGVRFSYPGSDRMALRGVDLRIPAGSRVAFVGSTGSGKSTLVDVLIGLLTPDGGEIRVDGLPVVGPTVASWQRAIGYVSQNVFLIDDTVARNIALGVPQEEIDMAAVRAAARVAQIDVFIEEELPHGYDTSVGQGGARLSGGEKQRLGLARAIYDDPAVLVLDEATSALDAATERRVREALTDPGRARTVIAVAHRLAFVRDFDLLFLVDDGEVVASGTWEELLTTSATFRRLAEDAAVAPGPGVERS